MKKHAILALALLAGPTVAGCNAKLIAPKQAPSDPLPAYDKTAPQLFDDTVEPEALGIALNPTAYTGDRTLRARANEADIVAPVRVTTVSVEEVGGAPGLHVVLSPSGPAYAAVIELKPLELRLTPKDEAYGPFKQLGARATGRKMIAFWKRFSADMGSVIHWHLMPHNAESEKAVKEAVALRAFTKK